MPIPVRYIDEAEVAKAVDEFLPTLGPEVVRVRYNVGEDWTGETALYFRVVLADSVASNGKTFFNAAQGVRTAFRDRLHPLENWGLFPYFSFRSKSEEDRQNDPEWS